MPAAKACAAAVRALARTSDTTVNVSALESSVTSALAGKQPLDSDLTALAALTTPATTLAALATFAGSVTALQTGGTLTLPQSDATNYTDIPGLSVSLAVGTYVLAASYLEVAGTTASDLTMRFVPGGGLTYSGSASMNGLASGTATVASSITKHSLAWNATHGLIGLATAATPVSVSPTGLIIVTVAGTLKMQARQGVTEATDTTIKNGVLWFVKVA